MRTNLGTASPAAAALFNPTSLSKGRDLWTPESTMSRLESTENFATVSTENDQILKDEKPMIGLELSTDRKTLTTKRRRI